MADKKSIVAVDDSMMILRMLEKLLSEEYDFHPFSKELRALKYLKDEGKPDLIILDIEMPQLDGYEILEMIRQRDELKEIPVLFLTSNNDKKHVVKAIEGGANSYVVKPIDEKTFLDKVHKLLKERKIGWEDV